MTGTSITISVSILGILGFLLKYWKQLTHLLKKTKLKILPANFNVGLSFEFAPGTQSENYFNEIKQNLIKTIDSFDLSQNIKLKDFSKEHNFTFKDEAEKFRKKKDIDLIIWGRISKKSLKDNGKKINKVEIKYTYGHPTDRHNQIGKLLLLDISSRAAKKRYSTILEENSFKDTITISSNIFDISTYILARILQLHGEIHKSLELLEKIYLKNNSDQSFQKLISPHIISCCTPIIEDANSKKNFKKAIKFAKKILKISPFSIAGLSRLALSQYKSGDHIASEETVNKMLEFYPNDPLTRANVAFFRILQKKYSSAFKNYEKLIKYPANELTFNPIDIVEFLSNEFIHIKDPALLYGCGIISFYFGDPKLGISDLKEFTEICNKESQKRMYRNAKKLINSQN